MRPRLRALAAAQGGLITRAQALDCGYTERELRTLTAVHGPWVIVRRGVYAERELWESLTGYDEQAGLRDRAVHLTMTTEHLMSHDSAARALGIPLLRPRHELSHVTREGVGGSRTERGVKHHLTRLGLLNTVEVDAMTVTGPARTAVDLGREHGYAAGVVACDAVLHEGLRSGLVKEDLWAVARTMWCWPGITTAKAAIESADAGAESPGETLLRLLVEELGIGEPQTQFAVRTARGVVWTDLLVGCHTFEFDGRLKFRRVEHGGVADRPVEEIVWDERQRQHQVCAEGLGMSRVIWDELFGAARARTRTRLLQEYAVTVARFGEVLPPHLATFDAQQSAVTRRSGR
jgi:hypothetical protein